MMTKLQGPFWHQLICTGPCFIILTLYMQTTVDFLFLEKIGVLARQQKSSVKVLAKGFKLWSCLNKMHNQSCHCCWHDNECTSYFLLPLHNKNQHINWHLLHNFSIWLNNHQYTSLCKCWSVAIQNAKIKCHQNILKKYIYYFVITLLISYILCIYLFIYWFIYKLTKFKKKEDG